jgi:hypothetical protein
MKHIKMLGIAVVASLAVMGVAGVASASANAILCSTNTNPCTGTKYGSGTKISAQLKSGTHATLTTSITNVTCTKSTVAGSTTNAEGHGEISTFTFSGCTSSNGTACTVKAVNLNYTATAKASGGGNGTLTISPKAGGGKPGASVECGSLINCTFTVSSITLGVTGGNPATIVANNETLERTGGLCPSTATWHATYEVTAPKPLFLV